MNNRIKLEILGISENESLARAVAAAFVASQNPTLEELADIRTAVSEAVTNSIVHGYKNSRGTVTMECELNDGVFTAIISDSGCGIENIELAMQPFYTTGGEDERSGMGFAVMSAFMDKVEVESEVGKGTKVAMRKALSKADD